MTEKVEVRFDERWKEGHRSEGGIAFIVDPDSGDTVIFRYKDGLVTGSIDTNLEELEVVLDLGLAKYDEAHGNKMVLTEDKG